MAQATESNTTSRRQFLRTATAGAVAQPLAVSLAGAAPLAGLAALEQAPAPQPEHLDAVLLQLGKNLAETWRHERMLDAKYGYASTPEIDREFDEARDHVSRVVDRIQNTGAFTLEGLRVKAVAILWCHSGDMDLWQDRCTDLQLARSIVIDLLTINTLAT